MGSKTPGSLKNLPTNVNRTRNRYCGSIGVDITLLLVYIYGFVAILNLLMVRAEWFHRRVRIRRKS
jgi:hypothetical protein